eukprot:scaffold111100_cov37-Prasinocladus_malaysianus.AAC.1
MDLFRVAGTLSRFSARRASSLSPIRSIPRHQTMEVPSLKIQVETTAMHHLMRMTSSPSRTGLA